MFTRADAHATGVSRGFLAVLAVVLVSGLLGYWLAMNVATGLDELIDQLGRGELFALTAIALVAPIVLHEAGHLIGGLAVGFDFALYVAGPVMIYRTESGVRARLHRHYGLYGGLAACIPRGQDDLLRRLAWMTAAGPIMSFALAALAGLGYVLSPATWPGTQFFCAVLALSAGMNFLAVTVPGKSGGFLSDRGRLQVLLGGGPAAHTAAANARLLGMSFAGIRPKDWPEDAVDAMTANPDGGLDELVGRLSFVVPNLVDRGHTEAAARELEYVRERVDVLPAMLKPSVWLESAFVSALQGDGPIARGYLDRVETSAFVAPHDRARAEAAVLIAEGRPDEARDVAADGVEALGDAMPSGLTAFARSELGRWTELD